jgi:branched-chain amino acid transport system ATP-binding protein
MLGSYTVRSAQTPGRGPAFHGDRVMSLRSAQSPQIVSARRRRNARPRAVTSNRIELLGEEERLRGADISGWFEPRVTPLDLNELRVTRLRAGYRTGAVVFDASLVARPGTVTALFGHNGAGKTSLIRAVAGLIPTLAGQVQLGPFDITHRPAHERVRSGLVYVPQSNGVFSSMSVHDNLILGATMTRERSVIDERLATVHRLFPVLSERPTQVASTMSGGQQRMLSIAIGLMAGARVLALDEPSLGLSPAVTQEVFQTVRRLADEIGLSVLLVEQLIGPALACADHVYVLRAGRVVAEHTRAEALLRRSWWDVF